MAGQRRTVRPSRAGRPQHSPTVAARDLAVVLHDLAWLLPRTIGAAAARADPLASSELEVMRLLVRRPGLSVNDVARELGLRPNNVSATVRSLVDKGKLARRTDPADARVVRLEPSADAFAARDRREQAWGDALAGVLDDLPPADRDSLLTAVPVLRALATRLSSSD